MSDSSETKQSNPRDVPPRELMDILQADLPPQEATLRIGNAAQERVPVHADQKRPGRYWVHFSDLSAESRHILDCCPDVELRVDGVKEQGGRGFQKSKQPGPVLEWRRD